MSGRRERSGVGARLRGMGRGAAGPNDGEIARKRAPARRAAPLLSMLAGIVSLAAAADNLPPPPMWTQWEDLPDAIGRKGMYGGVSHGHVILAGGSNFPTPQRAGGTKRFHADIVVRPLPLSRAAPWRLTAETLPEPIGEGATLSTSHGVLGIGGQREQSASAEVFLLRWNGATQRVERSVLPELPEPAASAAAVELDGAVYVAGGMNERATLRNFWRLDLAKAVARPTATPWERLPAWPGVARFGAKLSVITGVAGPRLMLTGGIAGPARGTEDYLREMWLYDPREGQWSRGAIMPWGAVLGMAIAWTASHAIILGGSDGHDFHRMRELGDRYRIPDDVLVYDVAADRWGRDGTMPVGVVGATAIKLEASWLIVGGEPSPGLRTPRVYQLLRGAR